METGLINTIVAYGTTSVLYTVNLDCLVYVTHIYRQRWL